MRSFHEKLPDWLNDRSLHAVVICRRENVRYFSGFAGTAGVLAVTASERRLFVDFRYIEQANLTAPSFQIVRCTGNPLDAALEWLKEADCRQIGFEEDFLTVAEFTRMTAKIDRNCWVPVRLDTLRAVKEPVEVEKIVAAAEIADEALKKILPMIRPGESEVALAAALEYEMRIRGSEQVAFDTIIASGPRSALPHGVASGRNIEAGDFVVIDFGAVFEGYRSDMTRTMFVGEPTLRHREIYDTVLRAQLAGLSAVKAGAVCRMVDQAARSVIDKAGFGDFFGHGLGHGVGLDVHEDPRLAPSAGEAKLEAGMVVTVEPGIYIPGWGGVRIEDLVVVTEDGCRIISKMDKAMIVFA